MSFVESIPRSSKRTNINNLSVYFNEPVPNYQYAILYFPDKLLNSLGWSTDEKLSIYVDEENPSVWKIASNFKEGKYKFRKLLNKFSERLYIRFRFDQMKIGSTNKNIRDVTHQILLEDSSKNLIVDIS